MYMALKQHEQFLKLLERSKRPLIVLKEKADEDDFVSAFGIAALLAKLAKPVEVVTAGGNVPQSLLFLKQTTNVRGDLPNIRKMTLTINARDAKVDELSYAVENDELF